MLKRNQQILKYSTEFFYSSRVPKIITIIVKKTCPKIVLCLFSIIVFISWFTGLKIEVFFIILLSWATFKMLSGLAAALSRSEIPSECIRNVGKNAYTASPTTAIPTKLPGIKWICTVMHFSGHIRNTLYLQESSWAVSWASHYLCSFQPTSLLAPPCSFLQKLLPNCVPPPQHMLFCSLMRLSQLLHSCLPPTGRAKPVAWTLRSQQSTWGLMEMTRFSGQCLWHHKRWTHKVPRPFPQHCPWPVSGWGKIILSFFPT